jgi:hypothetical protein
MILIIYIVLVVIAFSRGRFVSPILVAISPFIIKTGFIYWLKSLKEKPGIDLLLIISYLKYLDFLAIIVLALISTWPASRR